MASTTVSPDLVMDQWVKANWEEFITLSNNPIYADTHRFYYDLDAMRIEMVPIGPWHGRDNSIVAKTISLFATLKNIRIVELTNTSFQKTGVRECQPDSSFYIGSTFQLPPRNNSPVNLNESDPPSLAVEIGSTSLSDDLGAKRLLYERLGIKEYWVVNVAAGQVIAFEIIDGRSGQIQVSRVLEGLQISLVEEALRRSQTQDDGEINRWLIQVFSESLSE